VAPNYFRVILKDLGAAPKYLRVALKSCKGGPENLSEGAMSLGSAGYRFLLLEGKPRPAALKERGGDLHATPLPPRREPSGSL
jgi:hypothetical protein